MKSTCRKCRAFEVSRDEVIGNGDAVCEAACVLGFRYYRVSNEARPLEECPKPTTWIDLFGHAAAHGIRLPGQGDVTVIPARKPKMH